jgi:hypothetical protein
MLSESQTIKKPPHAPPPPPYTHAPFTFLCKSWSYKKKPKSFHSQASQIVPQENKKKFIILPKVETNPQGSTIAIK